MRNIPSESLADIGRGRMTERGPRRQFPKSPEALCSGFNSAFTPGLPWPQSFGSRLLALPQEPPSRMHLLPGGVALSPLHLCILPNRKLSPQPKPFELVAPEESHPVLLYMGWL